jgi:hypothetical protein
VNGRLVGRSTTKPLPFVPLPLPPLPDHEPIRFTSMASGTAVEKSIPWTQTYKYLGFVIRSDLLDDHAFQRVERRMKAATTRLFPHHQLVKCMSTRLKLQLFNTLVMACGASMVPLMPSLRSAGNTMAHKLDQLIKLAGRQIIGLPHNAVCAYVQAETGYMDTVSLMLMHQTRFLGSLDKHMHAAAGDPQRPVAVIVREAMAAVLPTIARTAAGGALSRWVPQHLLPLQECASTLGTAAREAMALRGWNEPVHSWHVAPHASVMARVRAQQQWISEGLDDLDTATHCFAARPPSNGKRHLAAIHFLARLDGLEGGPVAKRAPLSSVGPGGGGAPTTLSTLPPAVTKLVTRARQGNTAMHMYPFADLNDLSAISTSQGQAQQPQAQASPGGAAATAARDRKAVIKRRFGVYEGKTCMLCAGDGNADAPGYDLWHVLFECPRTSTTAAMVRVKQEARDMIQRLATLATTAEARNSSQMNRISDTGQATEAAERAAEVTALLPTYTHWDSLPGRWLTYLTVLAQPFPAKVVKPDATVPWRRVAKRRSAADTAAAEPAEAVPVEVLPDAVYTLPVAMGKLFDAIVLPNNDKRPLANEWVRWAHKALTAIGDTIRPMRSNAELVRNDELSGTRGVRVSAALTAKVQRAAARATGAARSGSPASARAQAAAASASASPTLEADVDAQQSNGHARGRTQRNNGVRGRAPTRGSPRRRGRQPVSG